MKYSSRLWLNAQAMRLLAAFFVVYIHLQPILESVGVDPNVTNILRVGTDCFLVLTAFLSVYRNPFNKEKPIIWLWKRLTRIIPLYWILTLVAFLFKNHFLSIDHHNTFEQLVRSLLFIPYGPLPVLYPGWSLAVILEFAILLAILNTFLPRNGSLLASVIAGFLGVWGCLVKPDNPILAMYTHPMLIDFFFGGMLAVLVAHIEKVPAGWLRLSALVCLAGAAICLMAAPSSYLEFPRVLSLGIPAFLVVAGCVLLECGDIYVEWNWIVVAARYTYCVYLGHIFWDVCLAQTAKHVGHPITIALLVLTPVPVAAIAAVLHHGLERPLRRLTSQVPPWFVPASARVENQSA